MSESAHPAEHGSGHEERDVSFPPVVLTSFLLLAMVLLSFVTMWWLLQFLTQKNIEAQGPISAVRLEARREAAPEPRLQTHPLRDLEQWRVLHPVRAQAVHGLEQVLGGRPQPAAGPGQHLDDLVGR